MSRVLGLTMCAGVFVMGCAEQSKVPVPSTSTTVQSDSNATTVQTTSTADANEVTGKDVVDKAKETLGLAGELAAQTKDDFVAESKKRLAQADKKLEELDAKAAGLTADAKARWEEEHKKLVARRAEMQEQLEKLQNASGDAWVDVKAGTSAAWKNLSDAFGKAATHFH